jgi:hypothetical protein
MPRALGERLEGLSAYRIIFPPHDSRAPLNPVAFSHMQVTVGGTPFHVLSRVGFAGLDYTGRSNKLAHHVVLEPSELPRGGPAWLLDQPGFLQETWNGQVGLLTDRRDVPQGDIHPRICQAWQTVTGDAGWAGVVAESFLADPKKPVYLVYEPGQNPLPLVAEALSLLPHERRWDVTFSTYFTTLPQGVVCAWRGVVRGSPEAAKVIRTTHALLLDLGHALGTPPDGPFVEQARTGELCAAALSTSPALHTPSRSAPPPEEPLAVRTAHVSAAGFYGGRPTLPTDLSVPPSPPPFSPANSLPRSRRRCKTAFVIAACGLAMVVLGGLMAFRFSRSLKKNNTVEVAPALQEARTTEGASPPAPPATEHVPRITPPPPPAAASELISEGTELSDTTATPADTATGLDQPEVAENRGATNTPPTTLDNGNLGTGSEESRRSADTHKAAPSPRIDPILSWHGLPEVSARYKDLLVDSLFSGPYSLQIRGLQDPESKDLLLTRANAKKGLDVLPKDRERQLATVWVEDKKVYFEWKIQATTGLENQIRALRSCVLSVEPEGDRSDKKPRWIVLRNVNNLPGELTLDHVGKRQVIRWGGLGRPLGHRLEILRCLSTSPLISRRERLEQEGGESYRLALAGHDLFSLKLLLEENGNVLAFFSDPTQQVAIERVRQLISSIKNSCPPVRSNDENNRKFMSDFNEVAGPLEQTLYNSIDNLSKLKRNRPFINKSFDDLKKLIFNSTAYIDNEFLELTGNRLDNISDNITILESINYMKLNNKIKFKVIIGFYVDGEPVEIASIGEFNGTDEVHDAATTRGSKP